MVTPFVPSSKYIKRSTSIKIYMLFFFLVSASPVVIFYLSIRFANYGTQSVSITTSDKEPAQGFTIKPRTIVQITKNVTDRNAVTFWAKAADHDCVLNNQPSLIIIPQDKPGAFQVVNITDKCTQKRRLL